jgi:hypothetical protein
MRSWKHDVMSSETDAEAAGASPASARKRKREVRNSKRAIANEPVGNQEMSWLRLL